MSEMKLRPVGRIENNENAVRVVLDPPYARGVTGLEGYSHVKVLWRADRCDDDGARSTLTERKPYKNGPEEIGVFATRSPERPNPVAVSNVNIARGSGERDPGSVLDRCL